MGENEPCLREVCWVVRPNKSNRKTAKSKMQKLRANWSTKSLKIIYLLKLIFKNNWSLFRLELCLRMEVSNDYSPT